MPSSPYAHLFDALFRRVPLSRVTGESLDESRSKLCLIPHVASLSPLPSPASAGEGDTGAQRLAALRQTVARLERASLAAAPASLSLGLPEVHRHLPGEGLPRGALHEVMAATYGDR